MDHNWKQDPRLQTMDPEKVNLLTEFAEKISHTDQSHFMNSFLQVCQEANAKGLHFTDSETALLVDILSCHMPEKDRKKLQFLNKSFFQPFVPFLVLFSLLHFHFICAIFSPCGISRDDILLWRVSFRI